MECKNCSKEKEFYYSYTRSQYSNVCKDCTKEIRKKYYQENKDKIKNRVKKYTFLHPEMKEYKRKWNRRDRIINREKHRDYAKTYNKNNRPKKTLQTQEYRAKKKINGGSHTREEWENLLNGVGRICVRCMGVKMIEKDHIIPISIGGSNDIDNLQPLCRSCNAKKYTSNINYLWKKQ